MTNALYLGFMLLLVGMLIATLSFKSRQLRSVHLTGSLRESLTYMIGKLDSTMKTYTVLIVSMIVLLEFFMLAKHSGEPTTVFLWLAGGLIIIVLSYWCGKGYVRRILGRYKIGFVSCLEELQAS